MRKENEELKKKLIEQEEENSRLKKQNKEYENRLNKYETQLKTTERENSQLKEESKQIQQEYSELKYKFKQLKKKIKEHLNDSQKTPINNEFEILDADTIKGLENIKEISSNNNSKIAKVAKKVIYALSKITKNEEITHKQIQHFIGEYEIMNALNHPNIIKTFGIFYGNEELPASILLEYLNHLIIFLNYFMILIFIF